MSKRHVVERMRLRLDGMTVDQANAEINHVFSAIMGALIDGEKVTIPGFGTFHRKFVDTRQRRNPKTGETVIVAAHDKITFKEAKRGKG